MRLSVDRDWLAVSPIDRVVFSLIKGRLRPELVGRITEQIVFKCLEYDVQVEIARLLLDREIVRLSERLSEPITYDESVLEFVLIEGFDPRFGARPLRRCIDRLVGNALVDQFGLGNNPSGRLAVDQIGNRLRIEPFSLAE